MTGTERAWWPPNRVPQMQIDEDVARRAIDTINAIYEQGWRRRAEEALVEAKKFGCGFTVTQAHGGFATAQIVADPEVPANTAHVHQHGKQPGPVRTWRPGDPKES